MLFTWPQKYYDGDNATWTLILHWVQHLYDKKCSNKCLVGQCISATVINSHLFACVPRVRWQDQYRSLALCLVNSYCQQQFSLAPILPLFEQHTVVLRKFKLNILDICSSEDKHTLYLTLHELWYHTKDKMSTLHMFPLWISMKLTEVMNTSKVKILCLATVRHNNSDWFDWGDLI